MQTKKLSPEKEKILNDQLRQLKEKHQKQISKLTLWSSPITTIKLCFLEIFAILRRFIKSMQRHFFITFFVITIIVAFITLKYMSLTHHMNVKPIEDVVMTAVYWIFLGVLSSIGLGTGLHTFVLYLGPFIAKVTLAATVCGSVDFEVSGPSAFLCNNSVPQGVTLWEIFRKVEFPALCWGFGTAIGELPPYFVARAARISGETLQELEEEQEDNSFIGKLMKQMRGYVDFIVGRYTFIAITALASIPNPLFDLAGLTCGYSLTPFWTFFGATVLGKSFIKAHLQAILVILLFRKEQLKSMINVIETILPFLKGKVQAFFDKEAAKFNPDRVNSAQTASKSILSTIWDTVLIAMLAMFLISIINSTAKSRMADELQAERKKFEERKRKELLSD